MRFISPVSTDIYNKHKPLRLVSKSVTRLTGLTSLMSDEISTSSISCGLSMSTDSYRVQPQFVRLSLQVTFNEETVVLLVTSCPHPVSLSPTSHTRP